MASILFGSRGIDDGVFADIASVLQQRSDVQLSIYEAGDVRLISSGDDMDQGTIQVAVNGYVVDAADTTEARIAEAYKEYGTAFSKHVDGAFRALIYDEEQDQFHAAADKAGRKVLYYNTDGEDFLCSSHLTPLLRHPAIDPELNPVGVSDLLQGWSAAFGGGERLIPGIRRLYPSHHLMYHGGQRTTTQVWDTGREKRDISDEEAVEQMDRLLTEGARKLVSQADGDLNVFLSGGFDSTFLVALLREVSDRKIHTYTWGWEEDHFQDGRKMAEQYGTEHTEIQNTYTFPSDEEVWFYEEPQNAFVRYPFKELHQDHGMQSYWTGLNSQATFPVCLKNIRKLDRVRWASPLFTHLPTSPLKRVTRMAGSEKAEKAIDVLEQDTHATAAVIDWSIPPEQASRLIGPRISEKSRDLSAHIDAFWNPPTQSYQEAYNYLQLRVRDTSRYAYYAQDMEHYDVYGYGPLLEFSYSLPMSQKKNRRLLQKIARGRVPDRIITKGASGWDFVSEQFRNTITQNQIDYRQTITDSIARGVLDESAAHDLLLPDHFQDIGRGRANQMIAAYLLERWAKLFVDRDEPWRPPR